MRGVHRLAAVLAAAVAVVVLAACGQQTATIHVQDANGNDAVVDLKNGPVLFVAYWCPHCEHFLRTAKEAGLDRFPTVVSIWPRQGDTLKDVVRATKAKLDRTGWGGTPFYVLMDDAPSYVQGTPTLAWWDGKRIQAANPLEMGPEEVKRLIQQTAVDEQ